MGKETIIYRDTREKVDREKRPSGGVRSGSFTRRSSKPEKKNISKKDSDKNRRMKVYKMA
jgi:hypothetical protein